MSAGMSNIEEYDSRWIDLAQPRLGSRVVYATDEFFAAKERLIEPSEPVFIAGKYDDHGKWMDGWETRRRRGPGHDHCILRLGRPGLVEAVEIDTRHFTGNFPPAASIDACRVEGDLPDSEEPWSIMVEKTPLDGDSRKLIRLERAVIASHLRFNIFPDGGVARLRVYGRVAFDPASVPAGERIDLAAMENGGRAVAANDCHFGAPANLIAPGPATDMGDGWETRRRREPGYDWAVLELACSGRIEEILVDTAHFKGNYPDRCSLQAAHAADRSDALLVVESESWPELLPETKLGPDAEHRVTDGVADIGPVTHVRLNIFPDGGVARLRLFGRPEPD